ncbi:hypothetical protein EBAPG3_009415 [Nitrosospira lacus]|uniref:Restriction endonuclease type IV Mrr domain-containing protein n=1 Tax=Nitrosospira lacus TaxID=1288494 RepID=A0A1W6SQ93_9PROT|nr:restriction endonuclease [Nitrosospira lacus]ARO87967.1 hypothetical protein EBAPG3_009415 [Nitrosospira lacus]
MPQRTNDFQQLIAMIYSLIVADNGTVTESAMVLDKDSETLREVDILIAHRHANHDFRVMIECRDRSRKDTVAWIDELIGKANSLQVDKVVAVSKEGFTISATKKAAKNGIVTLSLEDALETDWSEFPIKPGIAAVSVETFVLQELYYFAQTEFRSLKEIGLESTAIQAGIEWGSVKEFCIALFQQQASHLQAQVNNRRATLFKTLEDIKKVLLLEFEVETPDLLVKGATGEQIRIPRLKFVVTGTREVVDMARKHQKFNGLMISTCEHVFPEGSAIKLCMAQDPETKQLRGRWQMIPSLNNNKKVGSF